MLTVLSLAAALVAPTQDPPAPPPPPRIQTRVMVIGGPGGEGPGSLDKDGDGQVSRDEFAAPLNDAFARMDANSDGRLSDEELEAGHHGGPDGEGNMVFMRHLGGPAGPHGAGMQRFEIRTDGDEGGEHEVTVYARRADGELTEVEGDGEIRIVTRGGPGGEMRVHPMPAGDGRVMVFTDGDHGPGEQRIEIRRRGGPGGEAMRLEGPDDMDKDGDGRVTEDEFLAPMREAFQRMDADHSGALEAGENNGDRRVRVFTRTEERHAD